MDNKMLISMLGTTSPSRDAASTSKAGDVDADAFSKALEKATAGNAAGANQSESVIAEKSTKKGDSERRKEDAAEARLEKGLEARMNDPRNLVGSKAYLYHLVYKNPDALSLAEKQALKMGDQAGESVGLRDLQKMLADRGLNLRGLSFSQMADLTRRNSRAEVTSFLDTLVREQRGEKGKPLAGGVPPTEAGAAAASSTGPRTPLESMLDGGLAVQAASRSAQSQETAKAQRRQDVINQIVQHMELRNLANRDELHLKLNPEYLGELKIQLTKDSASGEMSARFMTTSDETRSVLEESRTDLRQHVERRGIHLRGIDVDLVDELT